MTDYYNLYLVSFVYYRVGSFGCLLCDSTNKIFFRMEDTEEITSAVAEFFNPTTVVKTQKYIKCIQTIKHMVNDAKRGDLQ